jgi:hypothetical protein
MVSLYVDDGCDLNFRTTEHNLLGGPPLLLGLFLRGQAVTFSKARETMGVDPRYEV